MYLFVYEMSIMYAKHSPYSNAHTPSLPATFMLTELEDRELAAAQERESEVTATKNLEAEVTLSKIFKIGCTCSSSALLLL